MIVHIAREMLTAGSAVVFIQTYPPETFSSVLLRAIHL